MDSKQKKIVDLKRIWDAVVLLVAARRSPVEPKFRFGTRIPVQLMNKNSQTKLEN
jgi:hypothetical protein